MQMKLVWFLEIMPSEQQILFLVLQLSLKIEDLIPLP